jgi:2-oxo-4-hydroxy-4-carboxy--5-ureidoimidazoline (OHCU) decarboxylase
VTGRSGPAVDALAIMPVCKAEAHRALELLEDYYERLDDDSERELKVAIERVVKIFKSRLFQARHCSCMTFHM